MRIDLELSTPIARSFRVDQVAGLFDVALEAKSKLSLRVDVPMFDDAGSGAAWGGWKIGAIVGPSGAGKSAVARKAFGDRFIEGDAGGWPKDAAIVDGFPQRLSMNDIVSTLNAVGFSSPPAWVLPYRCLSNGQRFRCDLARALLSGDAIAFDEFTSVVDRQVGQFASASVAKAVRSGRVPCQRFVAVTCHYDVLQWLEPDWILDMQTRELARGSLRRPRIEIDVHHLQERGAGGRMWRVFAPHHYLSAKLHPAARCYVALWRGQPVAFCATLTNVGHVGRRMVTRLVVLPDYQGMGIGLRLLETVCDLERANGYRLSIRTSHPALIASLSRRAGWYMRERGMGKDQSNLSEQRTRHFGSRNRLVCSFDRTATLTA